jgi:hypothetical protein
MAFGGPPRVVASLSSPRNYLLHVVICFSSCFFCDFSGILRHFVFYRFGFGAGGTEIGRKEALKETRRIRSWEFGSGLSNFGFVIPGREKF